VSSQLNNNIFLSIACWRDPFLYETIQSALNNAMFSNNVFIGVVFQGYEQDKYILNKIKTLSKNIKIIEIDANDSNASIYITQIRGQIMMQNYNNEKYFFQVDSHTKFAKHWDILLISELELSNEHFENSVLTTQSGDFNNWNEPIQTRAQTCLPDEQIFKMCHGPIIGKIKNKKNCQILEKFFNANSFFCYSQTILDIPYPDNIVFQYEQPIIAMRLWTGGYNLVSATKNYTSVYNFHKIDSPIKRIDRQTDSLWKDKILEEEKNQYNMYQNIFKNKTIDIKNGIMPIRSIQDYLNFIGYDPISLKVYIDKHLPDQIYHIDKATLSNKLHNVYCKIKGENISEFANYF
jgi:hypothetical protein